MTIYNSRMVGLSNVFVLLCSMSILDYVRKQERIDKKGFL